MLHQIFHSHMLWSSVLSVQDRIMNTFKEGGNSIFWKKMQIENQIKDSESAKYREGNYDYKVWKKNF